MRCATPGLNSRATQLKFPKRFKIQEGGYSNGKWATNVVIDNKGNQVIHIPQCIADGQYLLRAEMVALHGARSASGAQLYMECAQIEITGGGGTAKPKTYSIPGVYKVGAIIMLHSEVSSMLTMTSTASTAVERPRASH